MKSNMAMRSPPPPALVSSQLIPLAHFSGADRRAARPPQTQGKHRKTAEAGLLPVWVSLLPPPGVANCGRGAGSDPGTSVPSRRGAHYACLLPSVPFCFPDLIRPVRELECATAGWEGRRERGKGGGGGGGGSRDRIVERSEAVSPRGRREPGATAA